MQIALRILNQFPVVRPQVYLLRQQSTGGEICRIGIVATVCDDLRDHLVAEGHLPHRGVVGHVHAQHPGVPVILDAKRGDALEVRQQRFRDRLLQSRTIEQEPNV